MATCYEFRRDLNPIWISDEIHLDAGGSQVPGRKDPIPPLYKFIANSEWARSKGIVGKDIRSIRLIDLTYKKLDNWYIRNLSAGRAVNVEFARNVRESMIVQAVLQEFRTIKDFNLDTAAAEADPTYNKANKVGKPQYEALARKMVASVQTEKLESIPAETMNRIRQLEEENAALRTGEKEKKKASGSKDLRAHFGCAKNGDEEEEPTENAADLTLETLKRGDRTPMLDKMGPTGITPNQVSKWLDSCIPNKQRRKILESLIKDMEVTFTKMKSSDRPDVRVWATDWGLPFDTASKMKPIDLVKTLCAATILAE